MEIYLEVKEELNVTGGHLTVTYAETDAEGEILTSKVRMTSPGVETEGFDKTVAGTNTVTVTFRQQETEFNVTIVAQVQEEKLRLSSDVYKIGDNDIDNYEEGDIYIYLVKFVIELLKIV